MADQSIRVRIQSISIASLASVEMPGMPAQDTTYNISLTPTDSIPGAMGITLTRSNLTGMTVGKDYDLTLTPVKAD